MRFEDDVLSFTASRTSTGPAELSIAYNDDRSAPNVELTVLTLSTTPTLYQTLLNGIQGNGVIFLLQPRYGVGETPDPQGAVFIHDLSLSGTELPVELISFSALAQGNAALLRWATASEKNNAGFDVQMQQDDAWRTLGFVAGAGTTAEVQHYQYRVPDLAPGHYRFRLRQVDFDGATEFSEAVEVTIAATGLSLSAPRPNPASRAVAVLASDRTRDVRVLIYDTLGRRVAVAFDGTLEADTSREVVLDAAAWGLPAGVYLVRAESDAQVQTQAFIVR